MATLKELTGTVPAGFSFLARKESDRGEDTWELVLTSPHSLLLRDVSYHIAHSRPGHRDRLRYVIVAGQMGNTLYGPFCSIYDPELRSARIVDML